MRKSAPRRTAFILTSKSMGTEEKRETSQLSWGGQEHVNCPSYCHGGDKSMSTVLAIAMGIKGGGGGGGGKSMSTVLAIAGRPLSIFCPMSYSYPPYQH